MSMIRSRFALFLAPLVLAGVVSPVQAEGWFGWFNSNRDTPPGSRQKVHSGKVWPLEARPCGPNEPLVHQYHTSHYWPDPFRWKDREIVRGTIAAQRDNGWITATTLYEQHFDDETQTLNDAGRRHLRWILLHTPADRRMAWVQAGYDDSISQVRLASVQAEATRIAGPQCAPVMLRVSQPHGRNAQEVDLINRAYIGGLPSPHLPIPVTGGGGQAGGAAPPPSPTGSP
jgi:hypothetical protein